MRHAGGLIGFAVAAPLVRAATAWVAVPVLALIAGFGILVVSGTPVHQVPGRVRSAYVFFGRRTGGDGQDDEENTGQKGGDSGQLEGSGRDRGHLNRAASAARTVIEGGDPIKPYDSPVLITEKRTRRLPADVPAAAGDARPSSTVPAGEYSDADRPRRRPRRRGRSVSPSSSC